MFEFNDNAGSYKNADLFPAAIRAIEEDDVEKMRTLMSLEKFDREQLDSLVFKACERSRDIVVEEDFVKNSFCTIDRQEEQSMMNFCRSAKQNNEQLIELLTEAETKANSSCNEIDLKPSKPTKDPQSLVTPPTPILRSVEKSRKPINTPELPKFKSSTTRQLKFSQ